MAARVKFGVPILTMGPHYGEVDLNDALDNEGKTALESIIEDAGGNIACEVKEDGFRCQSHIDDANIRLFTRGLGDFELRCFPDVVDSLRSLHLSGTILDAEVKGLKNSLEGYKAIQARARYAGRISDKKIAAYLDEGIVEKYPLEIVVFDVMMHNNKSRLSWPYSERRKIIEDIVIKGDNKIVRVSEQYMLSNPDQIVALYQHVKSKNGEGLVVKQPKLRYIPDDKSHWIKFKNFETFDLVVVGLLSADKKLSAKVDYGRALVACYNNKSKMYETICVVNLARNNGATSNLFAEDVLNAIADKFSREKCKSVVFGNKNACVYVNPIDSIVIEVSAMNIEHTINGFACGFNGEKSYSLRIPHVKAIRDDKSGRQATTTAQITQMYCMQNR